MLGVIDIFVIVLDTNPFLMGNIQRFSAYPICLVCAVETNAMRWNLKLML